MAAVLSLAALATLLLGPPAHAEETTETTETTEPAETTETVPLQRRYELVYAPGDDLHWVSTAGPTLHRMTQDAYLYGLRPHLSPGLDKVVGTVWSMFFTYTTMLWPHELGHWSRARQVGGTFVFQNFMPLLPHTTMELPEDVTPLERALVSVGGFEVNSLVARQAQLDLYRHGGAWSDEMSHALLNELFFPIYAGLFPARAKEPDTWVETRGDPVHIVLPVYERYTGRSALTADGEVDPELVSLYRQTVLLSVGWTALDPGLWQQVLAFSDRGFASRRAWMPVRGEHVAWTWGTQFSPGPLGYELTLNQYLLVGERTFQLDLKVGRPFENIGARLVGPDLYETDRIALGAEVEVWRQDGWGTGGAAAVSAQVRFAGCLGLVGELGYKGEGYMLGRALERTPYGEVGLSCRFAHGER